MPAIIATLVLLLCGCLFWLLLAAMENFSKFAPGLSGIVCVVLMFAAPHLLTRISTGNGSSVGVITNTGTEGLIWKTREIEVSRGFTQNGTGTVNVGNSNYCVADPSLFETFNELKASGKPVRVYYKSWFYTPLHECQSNSVATGVEIVKP